MYLGTFPVPEYVFMYFSLFQHEDGRICHDGKREFDVDNPVTWHMMPLFAVFVISQEAIRNRAVLLYTEKGLHCRAIKLWFDLDNLQPNMMFESSRHECSLELALESRNGVMLC